VHDTIGIPLHEEWSGDVIYGSFYLPRMVPLLAVRNPPRTALSPWTCISIRLMPNSPLTYRFQPPAHQTHRRPRPPPDSRVSEHLARLYISS
jgi:hypothetical protein